MKAGRFQSCQDSRAGGGGLGGGRGEAKGWADQSAPSGQTHGKGFDLLITPIYPPPPRPVQPDTKEPALKGPPLGSRWAPGIPEPEPEDRPAPWGPRRGRPWAATSEPSTGNSREVAPGCRGQSGDILGASVLRDLASWELWRQAAGEGGRSWVSRDLPSGSAAPSSCPELFLRRS